MGRKESLISKKKGKKP